MEHGQQMQQAKENALASFYQNSSYQFERREKKTVILDVSSGEETNMPEEFNIKLLEPLVIDRLSDVYLDSFTTFNAIGSRVASGENNGKNMGFTLAINEFNNNSNIASNQDKSASGYDSKKFNRMFIPNTNTISTSNLTVTHKTKKYNYIASINPCTLSSLSGTLLDAGTCPSAASPVYSSPFIGASSGEPSRFIAEFMIMTRD
jgi:hypothetical protein